MKRAIVMGATGAVGTALVERLIEDNIEVLVLCRKDSKRNDRIPESRNVTKEYCSLDELKSLTNKTGKTWDVFYHLAWTGTFGDARNDMFLQNKNVEYTLDAVEAAKRFGCETFIGTGSQAEYGRVEGLLRAETPTFPENGYGIAKLCAGQMSRIKAHQLGMKHIWTRILSVYGPFDGEKTMVMSTIINLLNNTRPSFTKGEQMWDYIYSKDAAGILESLAEHGKDGKVYCIGSGQVHPLANYINTIKEECNWSEELVFGEVPYADKQVMYLCADTEELLKDTGYEYRYSFEDGIKETIEWYKKWKQEKQ